MSRQAKICILLRFCSFVATYREKRSKTVILRFARRVKRDIRLSVKRSAPRKDSRQIIHCFVAAGPGHRAQIALRDHAIHVLFGRGLAGRAAFYGKADIAFDTSGKSQDDCFAALLAIIRNETAKVRNTQ